MNVIEIQYIRLVTYQVVLGNVSPKERIKSTLSNHIKNILSCSKIDPEQNIFLNVL